MICRITSATRRSKKQEWYVRNPATGKVLRACATESDALEFANAWERGIPAIEDGTPGRMVAGEFIPDTNGA